MSKRADLAAAALERAIAEGTRAVQEELRVARARINELEAVLGRICALAKIDQKAPAVAPSPAAPPIESLPVEVQAALLAPREPAPPPAELAAGDNLGEGRWI